MALSNPSLLSSLSVHKFNPILFSHLPLLKPTPLSSPPRFLRLSPSPLSIRRFARRFSNVGQALDNDVFTSPETSKCFDFSAEERIYN